MADLTGKLIADSYKNLLQAPGPNDEGIASGQSITVQDGGGVPSGLVLSTNGVGLSGNITIQGSLFSGTGAQLDTAVANAGTLVNGIVAQNGAQSFGRTLTGTAGVTITNADGGAGNPTFALTQTSVSAGTYGVSQFTVDAYGRITDVTASNTVSANSFVGGTFSGSSLYVENNVSVSGSLNVAGAVSIAGAVHIDGATSVSNDLNIAGTFTAAGPVNAKNVNTSVVSATYLRGDGSGITGLAGAGTMTALNAGTGIHIIENGTTVTGITGSGTVVINADQSFGTVSATSFIIGGDNVAMSATVATLSATMATSIDNSNTNIAAVSALTSVNAANITTNINAITSVNNVITALSGTLATSISNATSNVTALSATMATSIDNTNTNVTALSATMATSIANHLPLVGGTMTGAITLPGNPSANLEAATKQYVDNLTAAAIHFHDAVRLESPVNLNGTYNNGTAGVGATLTNAGTQTALVIDGVSAVVADRVLVYEQTDQTQNGVYTVTDIGSGSTNWVLTRATDADTYAPGTNSGLDEGSYFYVQEGDTGAGEAYVCNTIGTITFGTTNITFTQFSSALVYTAGSGINVNASRVISVSGVPSSATIAALSATMATSIANSNTAITAVSATMATSIGNSNSAITALSATMATSINNSNTNITTNINAITSINSVIGTVSSTLATSISNHLPLSGGTLTGNIVNAVHTASVNATTTPDFSSYNSFTWTLVGNMTLGNPTTEAGGMGGIFIFKQDATGTRSLSLGSEYKTAGGSGITLSTAADAVDVVPYYVEVTGTILLGAPLLAFS
jgi:hypothetical protein